MSGLSRSAEAARTEAMRDNALAQSRLASAHSRTANAGERIAAALERIADALEGRAVSASASAGRRRRMSGYRIEVRSGGRKYEVTGGDADEFRKVMRAKELIGA